MRILILLPIIVAIFFMRCDKDKNRFSPEEEAAISSAISWLKLLDEGQFRQSWQIASPSFQSDVTERQWVIGLENMRTPYGGVLSRKVESTGPGGYESKGVYHKLIVAKFQTAFEDKNKAIEFVTLEFVDDTWKVYAYYLDR